MKFRYIRHQVIFGVIFLLSMVLTIHLTRQYALSIQTLPEHPNTPSIFYWLSPTFAVIQTGNLILLWGGALSCIAGVAAPAMQKYQGSDLLFRNILLISVFNLEFLLFSILGTYIYEKLFIHVQISFRFNILHYSLTMFAVTYLFLLFWSLIGYGLKLSLRRRTLAVLVGIIIQIAEYSFIIFQRPSLEKYLPFALSRQLVVSQFPFWEPGSWAAVPGTLKYASSPMIVDDKYNILSVSPWWIVAFLSWYLSLVYVLPIIRNLSKSKGVNENINV